MVVIIVPLQLKVAPGWMGVSAVHNNCDNPDCAFDTVVPPISNRQIEEEGEEKTF